MLTEYPKEFTDIGARPSLNSASISSGAFPLSLSWDPPRPISMSSAALERPALNGHAIVVAEIRHFRN